MCSVRSDHALGSSHAHQLEDWWAVLFYKKSPERGIFVTCRIVHEVLLVLGQGLERAVRSQRLPSRHL